jgi:hypothetical protein
MYKTSHTDLFRLETRTILGKCSHRHKGVMYFIDQITVTGGLGGIGSAVTTSILESGGDVICFDLAKEPTDLGNDRF